MTPIIIRIAKVLELPPVPYVIALVLASNTGGTTTLIGDPPNIIIGSIAKKSFNDFLIHVAPHAILGFLVGLCSERPLPEVYGCAEAQEG